MQAACMLLFWQIDEEVGRITSLPANLAFVYMAVCATARRLHDLGRSAWWMPIAALSWAAAGFLVAAVLALVLGPERLLPGAPAFWAVFLLLLGPAFCAALWLHVTDGEPHANRYGAVPAGAPMAPEAAETRVRSSRIAAHA
jgi:uncharacterized membrane protein YhaH (DUF805 family)